MSHDVSELVDLPDPAVQPLVHPLDLPEAARLFRASWWAGALASPAAGLGVATIVGFASRSWVVALIAGTAVAGSGMLASRFQAEQAWAFVPRRRQDRDRAVPLRWQLGAGLALAAVLSAAALLAAMRLAQADVPSAVAEVTFGMAAAAGGLTAADLLSRRRRAGQVPVPTALLGVAAIAACIVAVNRILFGAAAALPTAAVLWGAVAMLAAGAGAGVARLRAARSAPGAR